jgi:peptidoglycan/LPS O-acetylase OafA/YrhL
VISHHKRRTFPALTGLRAVAASWVVLYHALGPLTAAYGLLPRPLTAVLHSGWLGVDLFFVLSGFVITHSYLDRLGPRLGAAAAGRFLWARFARVWPVWAVVSTAFAFVLVVTGDPQRPDSYSAPVTVANSLSQVFMVQVWARDSLARTSYVVPGWSLSAEWLAYVCFPVLALVLFRLRRAPWWLLAAGSLLAMVPFAAMCLRRGDNQELWQLRIVAGFVAGALMNMAVQRLRSTARIERLAASVAVLAVAGLPAVFLWSAMQGPVARSGVAVLAFPVLVGALAVARRGPLRALGHPVMQLGGRISFSLYLLHSCVFLVFESVVRHSSALAPGGGWYALLLPVVVLSTVPLSWLLWRHVEEPSRHFLMAHAPRLRREAPATGRRPVGDGRMGSRRDAPLPAANG